MVEIERVKTGILGLDELLNGGIPKGNLVLVSGTCGTGKTTFLVQYIYKGVVEYGEPGVLVSFEESIESIKRNALIFGWDLDALENQGMLSCIRLDPYHFEDMIEMIETAIRSINAKRVAIDSISVLGLYVKDEHDIRRKIYDLGEMLRRIDVTPLISTERLVGAKELSRFGIEEFVVDGVIVLFYTKTGTQFSRSLTIWKMRGTAHSEKIHPFQITPQGIVVYPREEIFAEEEFKL